jgi:hypothetical protein
MGLLKPSVGQADELHTKVDQIQTLRQELEMALVKADRQRRELQALRDRADALLRDMQTHAKR